MKDAVARRLVALEARRRARTYQHGRLLMPWDIDHDADDDGMVVRINFVRPTSDVAGERLPYVRTGTHPAEDDPESHNGRLYRESAGDRVWTSRTYATGTTITLPHNSREPLQGGPYA